MLFPLPVLLLSTSGCLMTIHMPPPAPAVATNTFLAGAAKVDITPMPGVPMGGFAAAGKLSRGVWTRLYARAFVFEGPRGNAIALVSCDLWAIPAGFADRVAELVATEYGAPRLGREQIVVAATHTHHGPGNFSTSGIYNTLASSMMGFDEDLFQFLAHRVAWAIGQAWKNRHEATLERASAPLGGIARNRSLAPFLADPEHADFFAENQNLPIVATAFPAGGPEAYKAIDATLTVLRLHKAPRDPNDHEPIGVLAFYAVHPTSLGPPGEVYSADLFGVATTLLEQEHPASVFAVFNGAEGDVSSNWERQDRPSTLKLGRRFADGIRNLLSVPGSDESGPVRFEFERRGTDNLPKPSAGASMFSGGEPDWTFTRDAGFHEGMVDLKPKPVPPAEGRQWPKVNPTQNQLVKTDIPFDINAFLDGLMKLPRQLPVGVYKVGSVVFATLPGEFTTVLGRRIARAVQAATHANDSGAAGGAGQRVPFVLHDRTGVFAPALRGRRHALRHRGRPEDGRRAAGLGRGHRRSSGPAGTSRRRRPSKNTNPGTRRRSASINSTWCSRCPAWAARTTHWPTC